MSLMNSDLAAVSTGEKLYLYYQDNGNKIREASFSPGGSWESSSTVVADDCNGNSGSAITAYFIPHDSSFLNEATIHVIYINSQKTLKEQVKVISKGDSWEEIPVPDNIKNTPNETSRLASGTCHVSATGAHQWVYFVRNNANGAGEVAELRRESSKGSPWVLRSGLPQPPGSALVGTSLGVSESSSYTYLFLQDYAGNLVKSSGLYEKWEAPTQFVPKSNVMISSPIAISTPVSPDKPLCFFVGPAPFPICIGDEQHGSTAPAGKLGAAVLDGQTYVFHRVATTPTSISVVVYKESDKSWGSTTTVVS